MADFKLPMKSWEEMCVKFRRDGSPKPVKAKFTIILPN